MWTTLLSIPLFLLLTYAALATVYLLVLGVAHFSVRDAQSGDAKPWNRFAVLIPADLMPRLATSPHDHLLTSVPDPWCGVGGHGLRFASRTADSTAWEWLGSFRDAARAVVTQMLCFLSCLRVR